MIYLINGKQNIRLKSQMKSIVKKSLGEIDAINFIKHDASLVLVQEIVDDVNYLPLGYDHKAVVVDNPYFLLKEKGRNKLESDQDYNKLINCINHPDENCDLIFLVNTSESDVDKKSDVYQAIEKNGQIIVLEEPKESQWFEVVAHYFKEKWPNNRIDNDAVNELARRTEGDYASLFNNGSKLALYSDHITYEDVTLMVTRPLEENAFLLFNYLLDNKNVEAISLYRDLKSANTKPETLIPMIANQFRLLNRVSYLSKKHFDADAIASELSINPIRAKILKKNSMIISQKRINQTLEDLYQLDLQIKSGLLDRNYSFELFLINFKRN
ncbi:MAG: DNA polymerase III subunit delta [Bacilli bacterium]|nr:DNA polymerase III subunit delta [Bacilli bacterium]